MMWADRATGLPEVEAAIEQAKKGITAPIFSIEDFCQNNGKGRNQSKFLTANPLTIVRLNRFQ